MKFHDFTNTELKHILRNYKKHLPHITYSKKNRDELIEMCERHLEIDENKIKIKQIHISSFDFPEKKQSKQRVKGNIKKDVKTLNIIADKILKPKKKTKKEFKLKNYIDEKKRIADQLTREFEEYDMLTKNNKYDTTFYEWLGIQPNIEFDYIYRDSEKDLLHKVIDEVDKLIDKDTVLEYIRKIQPEVFDNLFNFVNKNGEKIEYIHFVKKYIYGMLLKDFIKKHNISPLYGVAIANELANDGMIQIKNKSPYTYALTYITTKPLIPLTKYPKLNKLAHDYFMLKK
jgi:hypothetical protein